MLSHSLVSFQSLTAQSLLEFKLLLQQPFENQEFYTRARRFRFWKQNDTKATRLWRL